MVELFHKAQPPLPLQVPVRPQVDCASATHWLATMGAPPLATLVQAPEPLHMRQVPHSGTGSVPLAKFVHVPRAPATLQALHSPVQAVLQQ
jgi:hypothetical protein